jgi:hypothetical protein
MKFTLAGLGTVKNVSTEYHENLTNGVAVNTRSQPDRQICCPHKAFVSYFVKNACREMVFVEEKSSR